MWAVRDRFDRSKPNWAIVVHPLWNWDAANKPGIWARHPTSSMVGERGSNLRAPSNWHGVRCANVSGSAWPGTGASESAAGPRPDGRDPRSLVGVRPRDRRRVSPTGCSWQASYRTAFAEESPRRGIGNRPPSIDRSIRPGADSVQRVCGRGDGRRSRHTAPGSEGETRRRCDDSTVWGPAEDHASATMGQEEASHPRYSNALRGAHQRNRVCQTEGEEPFSVRSASGRWSLERGVHSQPIPQLGRTDGYGREEGQPGHRDGPEDRKSHRYREGHLDDAVIEQLRTYGTLVKDRVPDVEVQLVVDDGSEHIIPFDAETYARTKERLLATLTDTRPDQSSPLRPSPTWGGVAPCVYSGMCAATTSNMRRRDGHPSQKARCHWTSGEPLAGSTAGRESPVI